MTQCTRLLHTVLDRTGMLLTLLVDGIRFLRLCLRPAPVLAAENLFRGLRHAYGLTEQAA